MKNQVLICRHCGNETLHSLLYKYENYIKILNSKGNLSRYQYYFFLVKCETCSEPSLYGNWEFADNPEYLKEAKLFYPTSEELSNVVPENVRRVYREASRIKKISPNSFVVQIRRALEYICMEQNATGNSLYNKLEDLAQRNVLPPVLAEATGILRKIGNIGAHVSEEDVSPDLAETIDDFFKLVIEYIYILPSRIKSISTIL